MANHVEKEKLIVFISGRKKNNGRESVCHLAYPSSVTLGKNAVVLER
jgi:hypothetical protein